LLFCFNNSKQSISLEQVKGKEESLKVRFKEPNFQTRIDAEASSIRYRIGES